jgi:hypothetical protein
MVKSKIPSTKAAPEDVLDLLKIINKHTGNLELMKRNIHEYLLKKSRRGRRNEYNSVYAICFPTLKRLNLLEGEGSGIHLSPDGEALIKAYEDKEDLGYKRLFAKTILRVDFEIAHVAENLMEFNGNTISSKELVGFLNSRGVDTNKNDDRLTKWLRYLKFVNFVEDRDGIFIINKFQINGILHEGQKVDFNLFLSTLFNIYDKLQSKARGSKFVKIPELEREVCNKLKDQYFTTFDFRENLKKLRRKEINNRKILFSKPGAREKGGVKIDGIYYYYISIFNMGEE